MPTFTELCHLLDLTDRESYLYELLLKHGQQTVVELARLSDIPRTQVYRLLEQLESKQLVERIIDDHRTLFMAEPLSELERLVNKQLQIITDLKTALPDIFSSIKVGHATLPTSVKFYKGAVGISQMLWHIVEQSQPVVGYTYRSLAQVTGQQFQEDLYLEIIRQKIRVRDIFSDSYVDSMGGWANAKKPELPHPDWQKLVTSRYLPSSKLPIPHQLDIYGDTVAFYNWHDGDVFGVEIINPKVAAFQKSIFELIWNLAKTI